MRSNYNIFNRTNICLLLVYLCAAIFGFDCYVMNGFFPYVAPSKNFTVIMTGLLYSEYKIIILILFPTVGYLAMVIGGERVLYLGAFLLGLSSLAFGLAYHLPSGVPFIATTFISRGIGSIGGAIGPVIFPALVVTLSRGDKINTLIGTMESVLTFGTLIGPTIGSILYHYGGYLCPFAVIGAVSIVLGVIIFLIFPHFETTKIIDGKLSIFITNSNFWVSIAALCSVDFTMGFQSVCFFLYCKDTFQMSPITSSLAYLSTPLIYVISSPFIGMINDFYPAFIPMSIFLGLLITAVSLCFIGPIPFLGIHPRIAISVVFSITFGIGDAMVFIPVFTQILNIALDCGFKEDFRTYSIVASCHGFFGVLAFAFGPTIGVFMYKSIGYGYSCGIFALFMLSVIIIILIDCAIRYLFYNDPLIYSYEDYYSSLSFDSKDLSKKNNDVESDLSHMTTEKQPLIENKK